MPAGVRWGLLVALLVILAGAGWYLLRGGGEPGTEDPPAVTGGVSSGPPDGPARVANDTPDGAASRAASIEALRDGSTVANLLTEGVAAGSATVKDRAAADYLAIVLGSQGLDTRSSCAFVQQVLATAGRDADQGPLAVDGDCGPGTQRALANAAAATGCAGTWQEQGTCLVNRQLSGGDPPCKATWPFRRLCPWNADGAKRALATVRRMPASLRATLDLGQEPRLADGLREAELPEDEAASLLPLAWAAAESRAGRAVSAIPTPETLDAGDLRAVAAARLEAIEAASR